MDTVESNSDTLRRLLTVSRTADLYHAKLASIFDLFWRFRASATVILSATAAGVGLAAGAGASIVSFIASFIAAILFASDLFFPWSSKAERHKALSERYQSLTAEICALLYEKDDVSLDRFDLWLCRQKFDQLSAAEPQQIDELAAWAQDRVEAAQDGQNLAGIRSPRTLSFYWKVLA